MIRTIPAAAQALAEVQTWAGIEIRPNWAGASAIVLDEHEIGHIHLDRQTLDMPLPRVRRQQVIAAGRAKRWFPFWVTKPLSSEADVRDGIALLRESYDARRPGLTLGPQER